MAGPSLSAWWQLLRAGNVFTAISNVIVGFLLVREPWQPALPLCLLMVSSAALYLAGMVLNDVFDFELDRAERPERPLPSGQISIAAASIVGWGLLIIGILASGFVSWLSGLWLPMWTACALAVAIIAYNIKLKSTAIGSLAMGSCRLLNVLLGASIVSHAAEKQGAYLYAFSLGIYTVGLTLMARNETKQSSQNSIKQATNFIQFSLILLLLLPVFQDIPKYGWLAAWLAIVFTVRVFCYDAYLSPTSRAVQRSVSRLITMFIPLDALVAAAAVGWTASALVLTLLIPTYVATRRTTMT